MAKTKDQGAEHTEAQKAYKRSYYKLNKRKLLDRQRIYRAEIKAKRLDNIAKGRDPNDGIPISKSIKGQREYKRLWESKNPDKVKAKSQKYTEKKKMERLTKQEKVLKNREYAKKSYYKNKEAEEKAILEAYEKDFGSKKK